jgi:oxygen-independent coproporphyrinogen-3 oxidase
MDLILQDSWRKANYKRDSFGWWNSTFFSTKNLEDLINGIFVHAKKAKDHEFFEGHPNNTTHEHLQKLMI